MRLANGASPPLLGSVAPRGNISRAKPEMIDRERWAAFGSRASVAWENRRRRLRGAVYAHTLVRAAGPGLYVGRGVTVIGGEGVSLGSGVSVGPMVGFNAEHGAGGVRGRIVVGDRVSIGGGSTLSAAELVEIEDDVTISMRVLIADHQHSFTDPESPISFQGVDRIAPVRISAGAWIGVGATILQGVTIGRNAVVGANSVVTRSIPDGSVAVGVPARISE